MELSVFFPMWDDLTAAQQALLTRAAGVRTAARGALLHSGSTDCLGLLLVCSGQLRAFAISEGGREITLYRLFERDICLFTASCMLHSIQFEVAIQAEKDTSFFLIPADVFRQVMEASAPLSNYVNEIMASRFSDVMWLMEQVMWKSVDRRLASFLLEECALEGAQVLRITHEQIANHLGTAREVVTRMLRYFQSEGMIRLNRGAVEILDKGRLAELAQS